MEVQVQGTNQVGTFFLRLCGRCTGDEAASLCHIKEVVQVSLVRPHTNHGEMIVELTVNGADGVAAVAKTLATQIQAADKAQREADEKMAEEKAATLDTGGKDPTGDE